MIINMKAFGTSLKKNKNCFSLKKLWALALKYSE